CLFFSVPELPPVGFASFLREKRRLRHCTIAPLPPPPQRSHPDVLRLHKLILSTIQYVKHLKRRFFCFFFEGKKKNKAILEAFLRDFRNSMQQVKSKLPFKLIYSLGLHPYLGYLIEPHIVQLNANGSYSLSYKRIFTNTIGDFAPALDETDYQLIKLLDEIEQTHIIKAFNKKAMRPADFFGKVFDEKIYERIRPKIEQKMLIVLKQLKNKPLFLMSKDSYPAEQEIHIADEPTSILFHFRRNETETRYFPTLKYQGHRLDFMYKDARVIVNKEAWLLVENTLYYFDQDIDGKKLSP